MKPKVLAVLISIFTLTLLTGASAAQGIACNQASSDTEKSICANASLLQLDQSLATVFNQLIQLPERANYRQSQKIWLNKRNQCLSDVACISVHYREQISLLRSLLRKNTAYQPDEIDKLAILDLKQLVQSRSKIDSEFALENTLKSLSVKNGITVFANKNGDQEDSDGAHFPKVKPQGVSVGEWRALLASNIDGGGENGNASYTLVDLDADGHRDLIIDSYIGGTGLFSYVSVLRQSGGKFVGTYTSTNSFFDEDESNRSYLYSLNGRGSNQEATLIRLRERTYFAYRSGHYGLDSVYLLRALKPVGEVPILTLKYSYHLSIPKVQKLENGTAFTLNRDLHAGLSRSLSQIDKKTLRKATNEQPLCPIPESVKEDERGDYYSFGPGHYSYEIIGNMSVKMKGQCYVAQVVNWFGAYSPKVGLSALLWMRKPQTADEQKFEVNGVRRIIGITSAVAAFDGDEVM